MAMIGVRLPVGASRRRIAAGGYVGRHDLHAVVPEPRGDRSAEPAGRSRDQCLHGREHAPARALASN